MIRVILPVSKFHGKFMHPNNPLSVNGVKTLADKWVLIQVVNLQLN
jgi:hypothetical protein